jgi:citrate lyase beta subunit
MNGLLGQTVIHPRHLRIIRDLYKVSARDLMSAQSIVHDPTPVNGFNGKMDERATHLRWAQLILERHRLFGDSSTSRTLVEAIK